MDRARGFCDLNIPASDPGELKKVVLKALSLGYQTVALNRDVADTALAGDKKKRKKTGDSVPLIPHPPKLELTQKDLDKHGITRQPVILTRLTISYTEPASPFLSQVRDSIRRYDIVAFTPTTEVALKQIITQTRIDVDIISLDPSKRETHYARKLLRLAVERDIYFELCYAPCITSTDSRKETIVLSHILHQSVRSANIIFTSRAQAPNQLRQPYDVMNLGRFFGLTEAGAKEAVAAMAHNVVYCATARRKGMGKSVAQIYLLDEENPQPKFDGLDNPAKYLKTATND